MIWPPVPVPIVVSLSASVAPASLPSSAADVLHLAVVVAAAPVPAAGCEILDQTSRVSLDQGIYWLILCQYIDLSKNKHVIYLYLSAFLNNEDSALDLIYEKTLVVTYPFDPGFIFTR